MKYRSLFQKIHGLLICLVLLCLFLAEAAKAALSVSMILYVGAALLYYILERPAIQLRRDSVLLIPAAGMLLLYLIQFLTSADHDSLLMKLQIKLPLILMLPAFVILPSLKQKDLFRVSLVFIAASFCIAAYMIYIFIAHHREMIDLYLQSKVIPGPVNHIRLSLIFVFCALLCWHLQGSFKTDISKAMLRLLRLLTLFFFLFVHAYSVRSGIIALYGVLAYYHICQVIRTKKYAAGLLPVLGAAIFLFIAVQFIPTLRNKVENTRKDIELYFDNEINYNSLGTRVVSYQSAIATFRDEPLMGCGIGDMDAINTAYFQKTHPEILIPIIPHNQFIYFLMGAGLLGVILFTLTFFAPLFVREIYKWPMIVAVYLILLLSFQTEPMIETQLGVASTTGFILLAFSFRSSSLSPE